MTVLDELMPEHDAHERHRTRIRATPETVWRAIHDADLGARPARVMMTLRMLPALLRREGRDAWRDKAPHRTAMTLDALLGAGFGLVAARAPETMILGVEGKFWRPAPPTRPVDAAAARAAVPDGWARALWSFELRALDDGETELLTETRIRAGDDDSRRRFLRYWWLIRPGSGLLRHVMLRAIRSHAERR